MTLISKGIYPITKSNLQIRIFSPISSDMLKQEYKTKPRDKIVIVLPTYNECDNIIRLIPALEKIVENLNGYEGFFIIVDDNSKDGTGEIAVRFAREYKNILVIRRPGKMGLGSAYRLGFSHAIEIGAKIVFMMDSDLSHQPSAIPKFIDCIEKTKAGLVIGSRYCKGGKINGWPAKRKFISSGANFIARLLLGLNQVHDTTSGYRAFNVEILKSIDYNTISSNGYAFLGEMLCRVKEQKARISEIPITFNERKFGASKLGKNEIKGFLIYATKMLFNRVLKMLAFSKK
ncbi:MAG TPA: polyprenol monophosphomannose synthase [Candidatus Lokiarchaeia archaeon]|nr:polyprenol monophosphomannose synthase [Candidatus Lokiarchaeia archaeon]